MVKWAIAAIPALLLLMGVWFVGVAILGGLASIIGEARDLVNAPTRSGEAQVQRPSAPVFVETESMKQCASSALSVNKEQCLLAIQRCTGNPQYEKCMAEEKRLAETSVSDRAADAARLNEERRANMRQVR